MTSAAGRSAALRRPAARGRDAALRLADRVTAGGVLTVAVAATLIALAVSAQGGIAIGPNTRAQVLLVVAGAALVAAAVALPARYTRLTRLYGGWTLALFGALTAFTGLSIVWSLDPSSSWLETNRTLSYLAAFAGGIALARLAPHRWDALLRGVALGCVVVCGYALTTKVFPEVFAPDEIFARLREPFGYWNALGLIAASGIPPLLWLAARRSGHGSANALAYPGLGLSLVALLLAYSRGALLALVVGLAVWYAAVPLRLRGVLALVVSSAAAAVVVAWAFSQKPLTEDLQATTARADAGHRLGLLLLLMVVVLLGVGLAVGFATSRRPPTPRTRRLAGRLILGTLVAALAAGVLALAAKPGGIDGQVSKVYASLTNPEARTPANTPGRLTATSSVRARYWSEAFKVHGLSPAVGTGAGAYGTVRKRYRKSDIDVQHAHGYLPQALADLGWVGFGLSLLATLAWLVAAARALGLRRSDRGLAWDAERVGLATLGAVVLIFGVHSFVDWTWFIPANAVLGLLCAGWVAGRGPLRTRLTAEGPTGMVGAAEKTGLVPAGPRWGLRGWAARWQPAPARVAVAAVVLVAGAATCWTVVQPLRAVHAGDAALARLDAGSPQTAADIADIGTHRNPLSVEPWWELAAARQSAGDRRGAEAALERAVEVQPASAEAWRRLGRFRLAAGREQQALRPFQAAYVLDPKSPDSQSDLITLSRALNPPPAP